MGFLKPDMPEVPTAPAPPSPYNPETSAEMKKAAGEQRRKGKSRAATILTGYDTSLESSAESPARKSLLGS